MAKFKKVCIRMGPEYQAVEKYVTRVNRILHLKNPKKWNKNSFIRELVIRYGARMEDDLIKEAGLWEKTSTGK